MRLKSMLLLFLIFSEGDGKYYKLQEAEEAGWCRWLRSDITGLKVAGGLETGEGGGRRLERRNEYQDSVENVVFTEGEGSRTTVRGVWPPLSNMIPDGVFVWRLGDVTLTNHRPLLILIFTQLKSKHFGNV